MIKGVTHLCLVLLWVQNDLFLDCPNNFGRVPIVLDQSNSFWSGPNNFGQVQIIEISPEKSNLNLTKMVCTRPKQFVPVQNNLEGAKSFWTYRRTRHKLQNPISYLRRALYMYNVFD